MRSISSNQSGAAKGFVLVAVTIIAITGLWQLLSNKQQELEQAVTQTAYISPLGEIQIVFPDDWKVGDGSFEEDGYYSLELEGPRNESIARLVNEEYKIDINGESISNSKLIEILKEPISADYIIALVDIISAAQFELSPSREAWKEELLANTNTASGTSFGKFEEIETTGAVGYRYEMTISEGENTINTTNYYLLGSRAEVEASIFPNSSNNINQAKEIFESIVITGDEEA